MARTTNEKSTAEKDRACRSLCAFANGHSASVPLAFRGVADERVLNTTRTMPRGTYQRLRLEEMHPTERAENRSAEGWDVSQLDRREVVLTLAESIRRCRIDDPGTREPLEILRGLGQLVESERISRAAVVLFSADNVPLPDFPQLLLKVARFKCTTRDGFLDNRQFHGNAFALMRRAERFLIESLPVAGRIVPGRMEHEDTPLLPVEALREALFHEHESEPWNPMIARTFYGRWIIETGGRRTLKIARLMQERGLEPPTVSVREGAVVVTFGLPVEVIGKTPLALLELLAQDPNLTVPQRAARLEKSELNIHRAIRTLRELGRPQRIGPDKGGH